LEVVGSVYELKTVKPCSCVALPVHLFRHFCGRMYRLDTMHSGTVSQTDRQTDDGVMPIAIILRGSKIG